MEQEGEFRADSGGIGGGSADCHRGPLGIGPFQAFPVDRVSAVSKLKELVRTVVVTNFVSNIKVDEMISTIFHVTLISTTKHETNSAPFPVCKC